MRERKREGGRTKVTDSGGKVLSQKRLIPLIRRCSYLTATFIHTFANNDSVSCNLLSDIIRFFKFFSCTLLLRRIKHEVSVSPKKNHSILFMDGEFSVHMVQNYFVNHFRI